MIAVSARLVLILLVWYLRFIVLGYLFCEFQTGTHNHSRVLMTLEVLTSLFIAVLTKSHMKLWNAHTQNIPAESELEEEVPGMCRSQSVGLLLRPQMLHN